MEGDGRERKRRRDETAEYYYDSMGQGNYHFDNSAASIDPHMTGFSAPAASGRLEPAKLQEIESLLKLLVDFCNQLDNVQMDACHVYQQRNIFMNTFLVAGATAETVKYLEIDYLLNALRYIDNHLTNARMDACHVYQQWNSCMNTLLAPATNNNRNANPHTKLRISERSAFTPYNEYVLRQQEAAARAEKKRCQSSFQQIEAEHASIQRDKSSTGILRTLVPNIECINKKSETGFTNFGQRGAARQFGNGMTRAADGLQDVQPKSKTEGNGAVSEASEQKASDEIEDNNTPESNTSCENWMKQYHALKAFWDKHGEYPTGCKSSLGIWVNAQRFSYKSKAKNRDTSLISSKVAERIRLLESLPKWTWDFNEPIIEHTGPGGVTVKISASQERHQKEWLTRYHQLKTYLETNKKYPLTNSDSLGRWIHTQRCSYRRLNSKKAVDRGGWPKPLESERIHLLEQLPGWKWDDSENSASRPHQTAWSRKFNELAAYLQNNDGLFPPPHWKDGHQETKALSKWISGQRLDFQQGKLEDSRIRNLESLPGWSFTKSLLRVGNPEGITRAQKEDAQWLERFNHLKSYLQQKSSLYPPGCSSRKVAASIQSLVRWISSQRRAYKDGTMPQDRRQKLSTLPGWSFTEQLPRSSKK
eukprot:jgi/Picsp_1/3292/NSC_06132-R1_helicase